MLLVDNNHVSDIWFKIGVHFRIGQNELQTGLDRGGNVSISEPDRLQLGISDVLLNIQDFNV